MAAAAGSAGELIMGQQAMTAAPIEAGQPAGAIDGAGGGDEERRGPPSCWQQAPAGASGFGYGRRRGVTALRFGEVLTRRLPLVMGALVTMGCASIPKGRSAVDDVELEGAEQLDEDDVLDRLATQASARFIGIFQGVVYPYEVFDPTQLERDQKRIIRYYQARGYYRARVEQARVERDGDSHVEVLFKVHEGPPTTVSSVEVLGLQGLPDGVRLQLREAMKLKPGGLFDEESYAAEEMALRTALTDAGYAHAVVTRDAFVDIENDRAEVTFRVTPGAPCVYGAIRVEGLGELPESHLRTAMDLTTGAVYSTKALRKAEEDALQLGVFNAVTLTPQLASGTTSVPIVVKVVPAKLRSVRIGGGARIDSLKSGVHVVTAWQDRNFLGDMRSFTVDARGGLVLYPLRTNNLVKPERVLLEGKLRGELVQPGVIEARTNGKLELSTTAYPVLFGTDPLPDDPILGYAAIGASAGLSRTFWRLSASLRQRVNVEIPFNYRDVKNDALQNLVIAYPELDLTLDLRDSRISPSSGVYLNNVLQVGVSGDAQDVRIRPEVRGYVPLATNRLTLAARVSAGLLFPFSYGDFVKDLIANPNPDPSTEQIRDMQVMYFRGFFAGGPSSNRGYPQSTISPYTIIPFLRTSAASASAEACANSETPESCQSPVGGLSLWEASLELRLRVVGPFMMAAFCDAADVAPGRAQLRFNYPHLSCGGGLRYDTAIGPIRLDVGYRIPGAQQPDGDLEQFLGTIFGAPMAISFGVGESF